MYSTLRNYGLIKSFVKGLCIEKRHVVRMIRSNDTDKLKTIGTIPIAQTDDLLHIRWIGDVKCPTSTDAIETTNDPSLNVSSLLCLNDDCLYEVFVGLSWRDLYEISKVCTRFKEVVSWAVKHQRTIEFGANDWAALWKAEEYLRTFGSSIRRVKIHATNHYNDMLAILVSQYCNNICEMSIGLNDQATQLELSSLFKRLHKLHLNTSNSLAGVLHPDSQLRSLDISHARDIPPVHMSNLSDLCLHDWPSNVMMLARFFHLNPQIEILKLYKVPVFGMRYILEHLRNVRRLNIDMDLGDHRLPNVEEYLSRAQLCRLHSLQMNGFTSVMVDDVLEAIVRGGAPLKRITLLNAMTRYSALPISRIRSIEYLCANRMSDGDLFHIARNCRELKEIHVSSNVLTVYGIHDMLRQSTSLAKVAIEIPLNFNQRMVSNLSMFADIADMRRKRCIDLKVRLTLVALHIDHEEVSVFNWGFFLYL